MKWTYTLSEPTLDDDEAQAAADCIRSGWLSMGPRTQAFEERFAEMHGAKHAFAVANGTAALHLAYLAMGLGDDDRAGDAPGEIIQPSMSFVAAANMTIAVGAKPVFADIVSLAEPTIDPAHVAKLITGRTRAVVVMHYGGYPARIAELMDICAARGVPIIEDACHGPAQAVPSLGGRKLGTFGAVGCFSFFANKNMTCGEGGMVITDDDALAARLKAQRSHGMTTLSWERHKGRAATYDVTAHGFNYRIDDLRSAVGLVQLGKLEAANAARRRHAEAYAAAFAAYKDERLQYVFADHVKAGTAHVGAVLVPAAQRGAVRQALADQGIQTSLHYPPIHLFTAFGGRSHPDLDRTEAFAGRVITLPLYPGLPDDAPREIAEAVWKAVG
ncbi:MAG: DegT/DnrJ/EryC1/StrS family aminotransferase [Pseudomonadota bacterium]